MILARDKDRPKLDLLRDKRPRRVETNGSDRDHELRRNILEIDDRGRDRENPDGLVRDLGTEDRELQKRNIRDVHAQDLGRDDQDRDPELTERLEGLVLGLGEESQDLETENRDLGTEDRNLEKENQNLEKESRNLEKENRNHEKESQSVNQSLLTEARSGDLIRNLGIEIRRRKS